jgi:thiamine biosynthesis lipoprotein
LYDIYNEYEGINNLCTINKSEGEVATEKEIIDLLLFSKDMYALSEGKVNVAMGSVLSIWHNYRTEGAKTPETASLPPLELLQSAGEHTHIEKVIINKEKNTVCLSDPKLKLDVGAVAKGYALEKCAEKLEEKGISVKQKAVSVAFEFSESYVMGV